MRDKLIGLINGLRVRNEVSLTDSHTKTLVDSMLADGWIRLPCKVGQTVYVVSRYYGGLWRIHECRVDSLTIYEEHIFMTLFDKDNLNFGIEKSEIGKTVFLTPKEANEALAERERKV